jgi:hypothetical protein
VNEQGKETKTRPRLTRNPIFSKLNKGISLLIAVTLRSCARSRKNTRRSKRAGSSRNPRSRKRATRRRTMNE